MVLGPNHFSIGARNCVLDQTESTNKAHDDAHLDIVDDDECLCPFCEGAVLHIFFSFCDPEATK